MLRMVQSSPQPAQRATEPVIEAEVAAEREPVNGQVAGGAKSLGFFA